MKKILYSLICLSSAMAFGQSSILNANSPQTFREDREIKKDSITPLKYGFIEDKDILRSMVVWEIIDMNDKINQPFYKYFERQDSITKTHTAKGLDMFVAVNEVTNYFYKSK